MARKINLFLDHIAFSHLTFRAKWLPINKATILHSLEPLCINFINLPFIKLRLIELNSVLFGVLVAVTVKFQWCAKHVDWSVYGF